VATELGTAYVSIVGETSKLEASIKSALDGSGKHADLAGKDIGKRISASASKALKDGWRPDQDIMAGIPDTKMDRIGARIGQVIGKGVVGGMRAREVGVQFGHSFAQGAGSVGLGRVVSGWRQELSGGGALNAIGMLAGKTLSAGLTAGIGVGVAGVGLALTKGFDRLVTIDTAKYKLKGLGKSTQEIADIVKTVTQSVTGTPFALDQAFGTATQAIGAGVTDIKRFMTDVADAAGFAGVGIDRMGLVFNQVQAKGKLTGEEMMQLMEAGLPAKSWIEESWNLTSDQFDKMQQKGEITMEMLQQSIEKHAGGMAQGLGNTLQGSIDQMQTAIARVGADFLSAIFGGASGDPTESMRNAINRVTEMLNGLDGWINAHRDQIRDFFKNAADAAGSVVDVLGSIVNFLNQIPGGATAVVTAFVAWQGITGIAGLAASIAALNGTLGVTAGLAAAAYAPLAAIAAIVAGGLIGGASLQNAINSVGAQSEAGLNMLNQATAPGMGVPGASRDPIFAATPEAPKSGARVFGPPKPSLIGTAGNGGVFPRKASGGGIYGPGSSTSDSIPALLSNGEHVLTAKDVSAMGGQSGVYSFRKALHAATGGAVLDDKRTAGAIPAAAGSTSKAGTSAISSFIDMGGEVINGLIDQAASAASSAASVGTMAAGAGPAGGAAAGTAIGLGTDAAKRGVKYGFDLLGILADSVIEQVTPFGQPRWLNQDYTGFMPQQQITGALGNLMSGGANNAANPSGSLVNPKTKEHGTGMGAAPGPIDQMMGSIGQQPVDPMISDANSFLSTQLATPESPPPGQQPIFKVDNIYTQDVDSLGRELNKQGRLAQMQYTNRPGP